MTTTTLSPIPPTTGPAATPVAHRVTWWRVLRSEWAKFWDLRSTWITLALAVVFLVGLGIMAAARFDPDSGRGRGGPFAAGGASDAIGLAMGGQSFAQLALGVLGVLVVAGEYSTGMIRSTLTAVPRRLPVLWAKAGVYAVVVFVVATIGVVGSFLAGAGPLSDTDLGLSLSDDGVLRCLAGAGVYFALLGVIGVALGGLLRSVAGGIAAFVVLVMLLPVLTDVLPTDLADDISPYLPSNAGNAIFALTHDTTTLSPGAGLAVFAGWTVLALAGAAYRLRRSDA